MSELPCKNPNCKSYGQPHPNCRCYGGMAEGGEVRSHCDSHLPHDQSCEYYKDGLEHKDASAAVAGYMAHGGLHALLKLGDEDPEHELMKYKEHTGRGDKVMTRHVNALFENKDIPEINRDKAKKAIHEWIGKGGIQGDLLDEHYKKHEENFAKGGEVKKEKEGIKFSPAISDAHPEQNTMLQAAKARASNYLTSMKPGEYGARLPFDDKVHDKEQEKKYHRAVDVAADPLSVLRHIKNGTIDSEQVAHLAQIHPEVQGALQKKVHERLAMAQVNQEKKPPYHVRQGLSAFLGTPLSAEMTPDHVQAAQSVFQGKTAQGQEGNPGAAPASKAKKNTAPLSKSSQAYLTRDDALVKRQQKI